VEALAGEQPVTTAFIELRRQQAAAAGRPFALQWQWRRTDQISQYLRAAVIYAEDLHFYEHDGVDWGAIEKAAQSNYQRGAFSIGGSTITQQLAKNLYLSPSRSLLRKAREILIAGRLEEAMDKPRILELYLNVVEWGDGVFGAEAAARRWFGRAARQLTPLQAARLAVALPNPFTRSPRVHTALLQRKVARILWQLRRDGLINRAQLAAAAVEGGLPPPPAVEPPLGELPPELREAAGLDDAADEADRERAAEGAPGSSPQQPPQGGEDAAGDRDAGPDGSGEPSGPGGPSEPSRPDEPGGASGPDDAPAGDARGPDQAPPYHGKPASPPFRGQSGRAASPVRGACPERAINLQSSSTNALMAAPTCSYSTRMASTRSARFSVMP
jgi:monofunctional biosynthetic peptidoglycan transglycosylase